MLRLLLAAIHVLWFLAVTYTFWAAATFLLRCLLGDGDPIMFILWPLAALVGLWRYPLFLVPPAIASFGVVYMFLKAAGKRGYRYRVWWPLAINAGFFVCFFGVAEMYRISLMYSQAWKMSPQQMHTHTFARSLANAGEHAPAHAELTRDGVEYIWSYSDLTFVRARLQPLTGIQTP